jgi:DNA-binding XRE family transcriptional regulator
MLGICDCNKKIRQTLAKCHNMLHTIAWEVYAMSLAVRLFQYRHRRGLTQQKLADLAGLSQGLIARIERGNVKDPSMSVVRRLATALGITSDLLIGMYDDEPTPHALAGVP